MNRKKILTVLLAAVITVGATAGVVSAVRLTSAKPVMVIPVTDAQGWDSSEMDFSNMYGYVTGQGIQNVEVPDPTTVKEVMVSEGDTVKKGDVLIAYDQTQTDIALRKEKLKQESIELDIKIAKQNLAVLSAMRPYQEGGGDIPDIPDIPVEPDDPLAGLEGNVELQTNMRGEPSVDERSRGYFHSDYELYGEPGTEKNPEIFLCGDNPEEIDTLIDPDFLKMMKNQADKSEEGEYYFTIETRKDNLITGEVQKSWTFKASTLTDDFFAKLAAAQAEGGEEKDLTISKLVMPAVWNMEFKDALPEDFLKTENAGGEESNGTAETDNTGGAGNTGETGNAGGTGNTSEAGNAGGTGNT
ncbi:MAG: biotin/lipoyl-binding protein, partial [Eubacterium sp.]|nr:biotin/lipoyl-binding protein [Eubacterium sp.]